jgi:hypothetical protein
MRKGKRRKRRTVIHPQDHLSRLTRRQNHLPLKLVRLRNTALAHRTDLTEDHVCVRMKGRESVSEGEGREGEEDAPRPASDRPS